MGFLWVMVVVVYNSDDGNAYNLGVSGPNASAGGFTIAPGGTPPNYPRGWVPRYIYGVQAGAESVHRLECASATGSIFQSATTFTIGYNVGAQTFNVHGKFAEKRKFKI